MLIIKTNLGVSDIHETGLFSAEVIKKGQPIWIYREGFDLKIDMNEIGEELRDYLDKYATVTKFQEKVLLTDGYRYITHQEKLIYNLDGDNCKYMNHSEQPNIIFNDKIGIALRDIEINEELTCDYRTITTSEHFEYLMTK